MTTLDDKFVLFVGMTTSLFFFSVSYYVIKEVDQTLSQHNKS